MTTRDELHEIFRRISQKPHSMLITPIDAVEKAWPLIEELQQENDDLRALLDKVVAVGHNDDCIFCGLKDRVVRDGS